LFDILYLNELDGCNPTSFEGWVDEGNPRKPNSRATPQDRRAKKWFAGETRSNAEHRLGIDYSLPAPCMFNWFIHFIVKFCTKILRKNRNS